MALLFQACSQSDSQMKTANCNLHSQTTDSIQWIRFEQHVEFQTGLKPFIPISDTMYCFHGKAGWGGDFHYICSIYSDSFGYKAAYSDLTFDKGFDATIFWEQIKPISPLVWKQVQNEFNKQNFWCRPYEFNSGVDGDIYNTWGREGNRFHLASWDYYRNDLDSLKILSKTIWDICSGPTPTGAIQYSIKGDSIHASIYSTNYTTYIFIKDKNTRFYYGGKPIPQKGGVGNLALPKKDINNLKKVVIVEHGVDGSIRRFRVSKVYQEK